MACPHPPSISKFLPVTPNGANSVHPVVSSATPGCATVGLGMQNKGSIYTLNLYCRGGTVQLDGYCEVSLDILCGNV
jgi:hypothetical protein